MSDVSRHARGLTLAGLAGAFGAMGGFWGKMAGIDTSSWTTPAIALIMRLSCYALLILSNAVVTTLFVRSMRDLPSTLATVLSMGANTLTTGLLGAVFLSESISVRWCAGVACICIGLVCLNLANPDGRTQLFKPETQQKQA